LGWHVGSNLWVRSVYYKQRTVLRNRSNINPLILAFIKLQPKN